MPEKIAEAVVEIRGDMKPYMSAANKTRKNFTANISKMNGLVQKHSQEIRRMGRTFTIAGGVISAALLGMVAKATSMGDQLDKMSLRTGIAVEELSKLGFAANITGTNLDTIEKGTRFLARAMDDMTRGVGEGKETFEKLGLSVTDVNGNLRGTVDVMKDAADKISVMTNETEQVAAATDLFGSRFGTALLPMLKLGSAGMEKLTDRAEKLGLVISTEAATAAAEFNDRMTELRTSLSMSAAQIGNVLIPALQPLVERLTEIIGAVTKWTTENPRLTKTLATFAGVMAGIMVVGGPLLMFAPAILRASAAIKTMSLLSLGLNPLSIALVGIAAAVAAIAVGLREVKKAQKNTFFDAEQGTRNANISGIKKQIEVYEELIGKVNEFFETPGRARVGLRGFGAFFPEDMKTQAEAIELITNRIEGLKKQLLMEGGAIYGLPKAVAALAKGVGTLGIPGGSNRAAQQKTDILHEQQLRKEAFATTLQAEALARMAAHTQMLADAIGFEQQKRKDAYAFTLMSAKERLTSHQDLMKAEIALEQRRRKETFETNQEIAIQRSEFHWKGIKEEVERERKVRRQNFIETVNAAHNRLIIHQNLIKDEIAFEQAKRKANYEALIAEWKETTEHMNRIWQNLIGSFRPAFENLFGSMIDPRTKPAWEQLWIDLADITIRELARIVASEAFQLLAALGKGGLTAAGGGSFIDTFKSELTKAGIGKTIQGIFGKTATTAATTAAASATTAAAAETTAAAATTAAASASAGFGSIALAIGTTAAQLGVVLASAYMFYNELTDLYARRAEREKIREDFLASGGIPRPRPFIVSGDASILKPNIAASDITSQRGGFGSGGGSGAASSDGTKQRPGSASRSVVIQSMNINLPNADLRTLDPQDLQRRVTWALDEAVEMGTAERTG